jgi:NitT/TauT family transport system permease protein
LRLFQPISRREYLTLSIASFLGLLAMWTGLSLSISSATIFLPAPWVVAERLVALFSSYGFHRDVWASIWRVSLGFIAAVLVSVPVGVLAGSLSRFQALSEPLNDFLRYLPVAAFIPLTILWVGIDDIQKVLLIFLGTVFQLVPLVADTVARTPRPLVELGYTLGLRPRAVLAQVVVPAATPAIYDHCRVALGWAWSYLVVAELVAATRGVGHVIIQAQRFIRTADVIAGIVVIGVIGLAFDQLIRWPRARLFPWTER